MSKSEALPFEYRMVLDMLAEDNSESLAFPPLHKAYELRGHSSHWASQLPTRVRLEPPFDIYILLGLLYPETIIREEDNRRYVHTARQVIIRLASDEPVRRWVLRYGEGADFPVIENDGAGRPIAVAQHLGTPDLLENLSRSAEALNNIAQRGTSNVVEAGVISHFVTGNLPPILENLRVMVSHATRQPACAHRPAPVIDVV